MRANSAVQETAHILVVDDDAAVRATLRDCLEIDGYRVSEAANSQELMKCLAARPVDLITLDIGLCGENGLDIARQVRANADVPIIMITGKGDTIDRIVGLEVGADDYIGKPFHVREVLARVRAVLRRSENSRSHSPRQVDGIPSADRLAFAGWVLDRGRRELVAKSGETRDLTTAEFNLLVVFLERPRRVLSRDQIMDLLKGHEWSPYDRSIDALIVRLRKKIEDEKGPARLIKSIRGTGYVFAADVHRA